MVKIDSHCESFRMIGSWHIIIESEKWLIKLVSVVHRLLHDFLLLTFSYFDGSSLSRLMADLCSNIQCITSCSGKIRFSNGRNDQDVVERERDVCLSWLSSVRPLSSWAHYSCQTKCAKMKENVSFFNIASEASYVYKLMKNAKISLVDLWLKK